MEVLYFTVDHYRGSPWPGGQNAGVFLLHHWRWSQVSHWGSVDHCSFLWFRRIVGQWLVFILCDSCANSIFLFQMRGTWLNLFDWPALGLNLRWFLHCDCVQLFGYFCAICVSDILLGIKYEMAFKRNLHSVGSKWRALGLSLGRCPSQGCGGEGLFPRLSVYYSSAAAAVRAGTWSRSWWRGHGWVLFTDLILWLAQRDFLKNPESPVCITHNGLSPPMWITN